MEELRKGALDRALKQVEKQFGKGSVMRLGAEFHLACRTISTGSLSLDIATGVG
ncbi:MAG: DNA recombination/repair protein RecA, partial [Planctomycetes bacterium]|nr:DNA recombination/repair protein RecA [Planctomycetota bacterium]